MVMIRFAETLFDVVTMIGQSEILPVLAPPFNAIDITNYEGRVEAGMKYVDGKFIDVETEPEIPEPEIPKVETFEEKMEGWMASKDANDLIILDSVLGVYEEIYAIKEELTKLKIGGITNG
ncbi:hypothetical protein [Lysinibacillus fusiformis]|uniref:Uncharacterized protein n=1 Tax=Lysinibacillus fusiformis TaxID=28031 RepID=A0A1E4R9X0_9BACI|nr:hypothetical protein [Lysinibacillus fusiformis]ODV57266.1 hypothetical protein BG258_15790 [Lysinibacillus fusiformis]